MRKYLPILGFLAPLVAFFSSAFTSAVYLASSYVAAIWETIARPLAPVLRLRPDNLLRRDWGAVFDLATRRAYQALTGDDGARMGEGSRRAILRA